MICFPASGLEMLGCGSANANHFLQKYESNQMSFFNRTCYNINYEKRWPKVDTIIITPELQQNTPFKIQAKWNNSTSIWAWHQDWNVVDGGTGTSTINKIQHLLTSTGNSQPSVACGSCKATWWAGSPFGITFLWKGLICDHTDMVKIEQQH